MPENTPERAIATVEPALLNFERIPQYGRISDFIAHLLGADILQGLYKTGQALPPEVRLAETLDVSRVALREGIQSVISKGMLETRKKAGTIVTPRACWRLLDPVVLTWMQNTRPNKHFMRSVFELRLILEPSAAAFAARRRNTEDLVRLARAVNAIQDDCGTKEAKRRAEVQFHRGIMIAARNQTFLPLTASIETAVRWSSVYRARHIAPPDAVDDLRRVLDAIRRRDEAEARWSMERLVKAVTDRAVAAM